MTTLTYGMEMWTNFTKQDINQMESIHKSLLTGIFEVEGSTPYWGLIAETGIWPLMQTISYKKFMLLHKIINSEQQRMALKIIENQRSKQ